MVAELSKAFGLALLLVGCGSAEQQPPAPQQPAPEAPLSIAGRWGMFHFEDPVAIDVSQDASKLTGLGCDAGLPMPGVPQLPDVCATLTGAISGDTAWFEFHIPQYNFRAEVSVSRDAMRMAGSSTDVTGRPFGSSWLRLKDDQRWLVRLDGLKDPLAGGYALSLIAAESPGSSFQPGKTYKLVYGPGAGIYGDLGAFYYTELSRSDESAPIQVGPVPATGQVLPVRLELVHDAGSVTRVTAVDAAGTVSVFAAARTD